MCIFHNFFVCIIYPYTYPYIILRQNSKKRKRKSIFFMHFLVESMKYSHFYLLAFFTKTNSASLLYSEILSLLTFSLSGLSSFCRQSCASELIHSQSRLLCRSMPGSVHKIFLQPGDGRTDKIQSASEPLTAFTIPWILSASVNSPSSRWITASPTTRIP